MRPSVMATPLTSGGKVSVTTAIRKLEGRAAKDSIRMSSGVFTPASVGAEHNNLMMLF
jgi:hypothetical protein